MALWEDSATGQPKWLLGEDNNVGLGSNHIKGITNITDGNEIETIDDVANGWVQWHSKENGKILGEGRGWWELLATMTMSGTHITVNQRPVATSEIAVEVTQAEVTAGGGTVDVDIEATDSNLQTLTYTLTDGFTAAGGNNLKSNLPKKPRTPVIKSKRYLYNSNNVAKPLSDFILDTTTVYKKQQITKQNQ